MQISWRTSTASASVGAHCVEVGLIPVSWHTSTKSSHIGECVEAGPVNDDSGRIAVRHSKDPDGPMIVYTRSEWAAFVQGVRLGEFDF